MSKILPIIPYSTPDGIISLVPLKNYEQLKRQLDNAINVSRDRLLAAQNAEAESKQLRAERDLVRERALDAADVLQGAEEERDELRRDVAALLNALPNGAHDVTEGVVIIQAMRAAVKEAQTALLNWRRCGSGMSTDFTLQSSAFRDGQVALAKLQSFTV